MKKLLLVASLALLPAAMLAPRAAHAQAVSQKDMAGAYQVTLRVLPPEAFHGEKAPMAKDAGATPVKVDGPKSPNHHLVAFVKKDGKPVEDANVEIMYRETSPKKTDWMTLPVVRMHVAGKSEKTTHYGNNVMLSPGEYSVRVEVNGSAPATFDVTLPEKNAQGMKK